MRRVVAVVGASLVLALVGAICLTFGLFERRMAIAQEDFAVLGCFPAREGDALDLIAFAEEGPERLLVLGEGGRPPGERNQRSGNRECYFHEVLRIISWAGVRNIV